MNIILLGYMTSGKSVIGKKIAKILNWQFIDLDDVISKNEGESISDIFKNKGEIYFRKVESKYLQEVINEAHHTIISLGGGTPCYSNNMNLIKNVAGVTSIYLDVSVPELAKRLYKHKLERPLVAHITSLDEMTEFVGKHIFERILFYNQADLKVDANYSINNTVEKIMIELF